MCAYYTTQTHIKVTFARSSVASARALHFIFCLCRVGATDGKSTLKNKIEANIEEKKLDYYLSKLIKTNKWNFVSFHLIRRAFSDQSHWEVA